MKNHFSKFALTAGVLLAITLTLGCEEKSSGKPAEQAATAPKEEASCAGEKVKLLESIANDNGTSNKFEYDDNNRIVKINDETITYSGDDLVTVGKTKYVRKGNTITSESAIITIDKDGYIVTEKDDDYGSKYQYKNGNLMGISMKRKEVVEGTSSYTYDDKKSPFSNSNTPKWLLQRLVNEYISNTKISKNNILTRNEYTEYLDGDRITSSTAFKYEYDSDGFPITVTSTSEVEGSEETTTTHYTYRTDCKGGAK